MGVGPAARRGSLLEAPDPAGIRQLVAAGVAILAESVDTADGPAVSVRRLKAAPKHPYIGMIRPRNRASTPAVRAGQRHLDNQARPQRSRMSPFADPQMLRSDRAYRAVSGHHLVVEPVPDSAFASTDTSDAKTRRDVPRLTRRPP